MYLNKVIIIGNLTRDPEIKALPSGVTLATIGVATNRVWKDKNGAKQEDTQFHNVVVFGVQADNVGRYLKKGQAVMVEGRLQTRSWDAQDGQKKYRTEIIADRVQFGPKSGTPGGATAQAGAVPTVTLDTEGADNDLKSINYPEEKINPEDIPF
mgnify:CR=1 FL=1